MKFSIWNGFFNPSPSLPAEKQGPGSKISSENEHFKPRMNISSETVFSCMRECSFFFHGLEREWIFSISVDHLQESLKLSRPKTSKSLKKKVAWLLYMREIGTMWRIGVFTEKPRTFLLKNGSFWNSAFRKTSRFSRHPESSQIRGSRPSWLCFPSDYQRERIS